MTIIAHHPTPPGVNLAALDTIDLPRITSTVWTCCQHGTGQGPCDICPADHQWPTNPPTTAAAPAPFRVTNDRAHAAGLVVTIIGDRIHVSAPPALPIMEAAVLAEHIFAAVKILIDERATAAAAVTR